MNNIIGFTFPCIPVNQPLGTFYVGSIPWVRLKEITYVDVRLLPGERGFESLLGIQRPMNEKRAKEIGEYITTDDASFPTAVILSVDGRCAEYDEDSRSLTLHEYVDEDDPSNSITTDKIAKILDGQHRIKGFDNADFEGTFDINVSIFIDIDIADQAYLFSTINLAQTKVNKSLVFDLFSLSKFKN